MQRSIKFRAKIKGDAVVYKVWGINWLDQKMLIERACGNEWVPFDKIESLMQFTGLTDKNKVRIFEGDIVKIDRFTETMQGKVEYSNNLAAFIVRISNYRTLESFPLLLVEMGTRAVEVIGNIYENQLKEE